MRVLLCLLLLCSPAAAQSFLPSLAGQRYCMLRSFGVDPGHAIEVAIDENYDPNRRPVPVRIKGKLLTTDIVDFYTWVLRCR